MTMGDEDDPMHPYTVVVNNEGQYTIWPAWREMPRGWVSAGFEGTQRACLERVKQLWTESGNKSAQQAPSDRRVAQGNTDVGRQRLCKWSLLALSDRQSSLRRLRDQPPLLASAA